MRHIRFIPENGSLVEVTVRTFQSCFLLRPSLTLNKLIAGVLGRAQDKYPVLCHAAVFLSTHFHLLLTVDNAERLADFMEYVNTNIAREVNRLYNRKGSVFGHRYHAILVSNEEAAQVERLRYLLAHGCISYCTSFQDLLLEIPAERLGGVRSGPSADTS
jgi:hypothetical protein